MRTSLVDCPSCVAQGRLIAARFPDWDVWQDGMEKADGVDSQAVRLVAEPSPVALRLNMRLRKVEVVMSAGEGITNLESSFFKESCSPCSQIPFKWLA